MTYYVLKPNNNYAYNQPQSFFLTDKYTHMASYNKLLICENEHHQIST